MKDVWKKIVSIACVAILAGGFIWGVFRGSGKSAYELAVENGFKGTEKEWLASLKGANGNDAQDLDINEMYNSAVAKGYTGSFMDFLKETFNIDVKDDNDTSQIAENAMSVVNVACGFKQKTTTTISPLASPYYYPASAGAGVIIDLDKENGNALIVTNFHVVYEKDGLEEDHISERIYVYPCGSFVNYNQNTGVDDGPDGILATYVGGSMNYDIALLQVSGSEILKRSAVTEAEIGDSENVQMGDKVFPIGNPGGDGVSVTSGIISMTSENIVLDAPDGSGDLKIRVMRTDAAINGGNSGGGLFDSQGKLIGIVNAKSVASAVDNVGYAIPINLAKAVWENIQANNREMKRALMGVTVTIADSTASLENGKIKITEVIQVIEKDAAGNAYTIKPDALAYGKLKHGDIIKGASINDGKTTFFARQYNMLDFFLTIRLNDKVKLIIERDGEEKEVEFHFNNIKNFNKE